LGFCRRRRGRRWRAPPPPPAPPPPSSTRNEKVTWAMQFIAKSSKSSKKLRKRSTLLCSYTSGVPFSEMSTVFALARRWDWRRVLSLDVRTPRHHADHTVTDTHVHKMFYA